MKKLFWSIILCFALVCSFCVISASAADTFTVTFDTSGICAAPASQQIANDGMVTQPTSPNPAGYVFFGWFKDSACTQAWNFGTDTISADTVIYAGLDPLVSVTANVKWGDTSNLEGFRPASVQLTLMYSTDGGSTWNDVAKMPVASRTFGVGVYTSSDVTQTLSNPGGGTVDTWASITWNDLSAHILDGSTLVPVTYKVVGNTVTNYTQSLSGTYTYGGDSKNGAISLSYLLEGYVSAVAKVVWDGVSKYSDIRPDSIAFYLQYKLPSDPAWTDAPVLGGASAADVDSWTYTFVMKEDGKLFRILLISMTDGSTTTPASDKNTEGTAGKLGQFFTYDSVFDGNNVTITISHVHNITSAGEQAPTCTEDGWYEYYSCECGVCFTDLAGTNEIPDINAWKAGPGKRAKLGHDIQTVSAQNPTCTDIGWYAYEYCSRCTYTTYVERPALGHGVQHHAAQNPSCTDIGWYAYDTCSRCDYSTYVERPALGHDIQNHIAQSATCTSAGWDAYEDCSRCSYTTYVEIPMLGHDITQHAAQDPTCTAAGWYAYEDCSRCTYTTYVSRPMLGHDIQSHTAKNPTCTEIGWDAYDTCSRCDYTTYVEKPALGHDIQSHTAQSASCTAIGWYAYEDCSRCDYTTYVEIPMLGHDIQHHAAQTVSCTEIGWDAYDTCSRCDYSTYVEIPMLGHDIQHHAAQDPTCTEVGWYAYDDCSRCDYSTYVEKPALGHDIQSHTAQSASCTAIGWYAYEDCSRCSYSTYVEIAALGHNITHHTAKAATCTAKGWDAYDTCSRCDYSTYVEHAALGHDILHHNYQAPTCATVGWFEYENCSRCSYTTYVEIPMIGHSFVHHEAFEPTCTTMGWNAYDVCTVCGFSTYQKLAPKGHTYNNFVSNGDATCTQDGTKTGSCIRCGVTTTVVDEGSALGHDLIYHPGKEATLTESGWEPYYTCSRCDYTTFQESHIKGHHVTLYPGQLPTCTEAGWYAYTICSDCGFTTYREIAPLGHSFTNYTSNGDATCTHNGTKTAKCDRCDATITVVDENSMTEHTGGTATCCAKAICTVCGKEYGEINPNAHEKTEFRGVVPASCTGEGYTGDMYCLDCGRRLSVGNTVPALMHVPSVEPTILPDCTHGGLQGGSHCTICGKLLQEPVVIPALGHNFVNGKCTVCGEADPSYDPSKRSVDGQSGNTWTEGSGDDLPFVVNGGVADIAKVLVDNVELTSDKYTIDPSASTVTLSAAFLGTLTPGTHTLTIVFTDGTTCSTVFEIKAASAQSETTTDISTAVTEDPAQTTATTEVPGGDGSSSGWWIVLLIVGSLLLIIIIIIILLLKKKDEDKDGDAPKDEETTENN